MLRNLSGKKADDGYKRKKLSLNNETSMKIDDTSCGMELAEVEGKNIVISIFYKQKFWCFNFFYYFSDGEVVMVPVNGESVAAQTKETKTAENVKRIFLLLFGKKIFN